MYQKIIFKDRIDSNPTTYLVDKKTVTVEKDNAGLKQQGTLLNAENLNHLEDGIYNNSVDIEDLRKKTKQAFQSGVKAKQNVVTALTSKGVKVTTEDSWEKIINCITNNANGELNLQIEKHITNNYKSRTSWVVFNKENDKMFIYCSVYQSNIIDKIDMYNDNVVWSFETEDKNNKFIINNNNIFYANDSYVGLIDNNKEKKWEIEKHYFNYDIKIDNNNDIVCCGLSNAIKLNSVGEVVWEYRSNLEKNYFDYIEIDDNNNIFLSGSKSIEKLTTTGKKICDFFINTSETKCPILIIGNIVYIGVNDVNYKGALCKYTIVGKKIEELKTEDCIFYIKKIQNDMVYGGTLNIFVKHKNNTIKITDSFLEDIDIFVNNNTLSIVTCAFAGIENYNITIN